MDTLLVRAVLFIPILLCIAGALAWKPYKLKVAANQGAESLARYVRLDARHLSSISSCVEVSKNSSTIDTILARECALRLLEFLSLTIRCLHYQH